MLIHQSQRAVRRWLVPSVSSSRLFSDDSKGWQEQHQQHPQENIDFGYQEVPVTDKVNLVRQVFSNVAGSYDVMNDLMSAGMHRLWKDRLVSTLNPAAGQDHLDVAGGTGDVGFRVLRAIRQAEQQMRQLAPEVQIAPGSVTVCDINPDMLQVGRQKAAAAADLSGDAGLTFVEGNAERLPFEDNSRDSYTIAFGIRNVTDRDAALAEALRILRPGGRFMCLEFSQVSVPVLKELYDLYSFNVIPKIGAAVANDEASYQYLVESIRRFPDQETFAGMIRRAGFSYVSYDNIQNGVVAMHSGFKMLGAAA